MAKGNYLKSLKISTPAYVALISYVVLCIAVLRPVEYQYQDSCSSDIKTRSYNLGERVLIILMMTLPIALSVYSINCMMVGNCVALSWVVSLITVFWVAVFVITAFIFTFGSK